MIRCPACSTPMYRRAFKGTQLEGCPDCGGIWMDAGELQTLAREPELLRGAHREFQPRGHKPPAPGSRQCPHCAQGLNEFEYKSFRGVRLDRCPSCEGVWLDHGEALAIADRLSPAAAEAAAPSAAEAAAVARAVAARFGPPGSPRSAEPAQAGVADETRTAGVPVVRGRAVPGFDAQGGFVGSLERGLRFIRGAYGLASEKPMLVAPMAIGAIVQLLLGALTLVLFWMKARAGTLELESVSGAWMQAHAIAVVAATVVLGLALQLVNMAVLGMTVNMVDAWLKGREPSLRVALRDVLQNFWAIAAMAAINAIVEALTSRNRRNRGMIANALAGAVQAAWTVLSFLLMPIIIVEDVGLGQALRRARDIHRRGLMQIAVGEVGLRLISGITAMLFVSLLALVAFVAAPLTMTDVVGIAVFALVGGVPLGVLNAFARGAYYTCLYLWAVELERARVPGEAIVPGPLATALVPRS